jgi:hypothetical protein
MAYDRFGLSSGGSMVVWRDGEGISISGTSGRRTVHSPIPDDLRAEMFRAHIHMDGEQPDTHPSLAGIAPLHDVDPVEEASIRAIEDVRESYSKQRIDARNLRDSWRNEGKMGGSRREGC